MEGVASNASVGVNPTVGYDVATSYDRKNEELVAESIAVLGSSVITGHTDVADCHTENTPMPVAMFAGKNDEAFCQRVSPNSGFTVPSRRATNSFQKNARSWTKANGACKKGGSPIIYRLIRRCRVRIRLD